MQAGMCLTVWRMAFKGRKTVSEWVCIFTVIFIIGWRSFRFSAKQKFAYVCSVQDTECGNTCMHLHTPCSTCHCERICSFILSKVTDYELDDRSLILRMGGAILIFTTMRSVTQVVSYPIRDWNSFQKGKSGRSAELTILLLVPRLVIC
jgi:hypothetical protein